LRKEKGVVEESENTHFDDDEEGEGDERDFN
jgi:hypothetical protein